MNQAALRVGDEVEVRSAAEILDTLDDKATLAGLPFMPEMLRYCGHRFVVSARAERICDTILTRGGMQLPDAVVLEDLRCDGRGHDGCEAECRLFWKEAWLRRVSEAPPAKAGDDGKRTELERRVTAPCKQCSVLDGQPNATYRCQATELVRASRRVRLRDPRPYLRVLRSGGVSFGRFLRVMGRVVVQETLSKLGLVPAIHLAGDGPTSVDEPALHLQPGEWVQVKSMEEIRRTLTPRGRHRGLWFDREMMSFCGKTYRVRRRVERIVDEPTGRMLTFKRDCIMLEGVVCSGEKSLGRWFCPRAIYPYWREIWLKRVNAETTDRLAERAGSPGRDGRIPDGPASPPL